MNQPSDRQSLPALELGEHCPVHWEGMREDGNARWCHQCQRKLHDFAKMTAQEVLALFEGDPGGICALVQIDSLDHIRTRAAAAGLILSAVLTMPVTALAAQNQPQANQPTQDQEKPQTARTRTVRPTGVRGVVDISGTPLAGVRVTAARSDGLQALTVTGPDGSYSFSDLMPGSYWLSFVASGRNPWNIQNVEVCSGIVLVRDTGIRPTFAGRVIQPRNTAEPGKEGIQGTLTSSTGTAISQAKVTAVSLANHTSDNATTDAGGHFSFVGLKPGKYSLTFSAPGFSSQTVAAPEVAPGQFRIQDAQLCPKE
jgi:hypothetical protein